MDRIGWHAAPSEGSLFAWLPVPSGYSAYSFANLLLRKALVAAAPGNAFGEFGEGHVRLGLLTGEERLREAMRRIGALSVF
jgi:aminotransferase